MIFVHACTMTKSSILHASNSVCDIHLRFKGILSVNQTTQSLIDSNCLQLTSGQLRTSYMLRIVPAIRSNPSLFLIGVPH